MKLQLNGIEIDLPNDAQVQVSEDGKSVKIGLPKAQVIEKIRVVETPGPERIVEKYVPYEVPCNKQHYPTYPTYPYKPWYERGTADHPDHWGTITVSSTPPATSGYVYVDGSNLQNVSDNVSWSTSKTTLKT